MDTQALRQARGRAWVRLYRQAHTELGPLVERDARAIEAICGRITLVDVGRLAVRYDLCLKHTIEILEARRVLPTGTYTMLKERGLKASDVLEAARQLETDPQP